MLQKESLEKGVLFVTIIPWAWACIVYSNISALAPDEASANLARSILETPQTLAGFLVRCFTNFQFTIFNFQSMPQFINFQTLFYGSFLKIIFTFSKLGH